MNELIVSAIILLILDAGFIYLNKHIFQSQIVAVQHTSLILNYGGVLLSYLLLIFGLYYFILRQHRSVPEAVIFGLVLYGVYETTSYAMLKNWRLSTVFIDTIWGGALMGLTTASTYWISRKL